MNSLMQEHTISEDVRNENNVAGRRKEKVLDFVGNSGIFMREVEKRTY